MDSEISVTSVSPQYLAGFFDGEGYVGVIPWNHGASYSLRLQLTNTHRETLETIQTQYGGTINAHDHKQRVGWANTYVLRWAGLQAKEILNQIAPYVITKRQRVQLALQFPTNDIREYRPVEKRQEQIRVYESMKRLNHQKIAIPEQYQNLAYKEHSEYLRKKEQAVTLRNTHPDWSIRQIAAELKVSSTMVHKYLKQAGVSTKSKGFGDGVKGKLVYTYRKTPRVTELQ